MDEASAAPPARRCRVADEARILAVIAALAAPPRDIRRADRIARRAPPRHLGGMPPADSPKGAPIESAPRDGRPVLVWLKASEQGPAQLDVVRWARSARTGEGAWVASDSDQVARVAYSDADLECWMPLPTQDPGRRADERPARGIDTDTGEVDGGGI
jgi:hypothetical protein